MILKEEFKILADCAENYPAGWGDSYFFDGMVYKDYDAVAEIHDNPEREKFG